MNSDIVALENGHLGSRAVKSMDKWIDNCTAHMKRRLEEDGGEMEQRLYRLRRAALAQGYRKAYVDGFMEGRNDGEMEMMGTMLEEAANCDEHSFEAPPNLDRVLWNLNEHAIQAIVFVLLSRFGSEAFMHAVRESDELIGDSGFDDYEQLFPCVEAAA